MNSSPNRVLRIATRQSELALWQARHVAELLRLEGVASQLVPLTSEGDTDMRAIDGSRQVGLFTKRIQQAVLDDDADVAVHSLKDLPTETDARLILAAVPRREDVTDCLVSPDGIMVDQLPRSARIGTGSTRRKAQLARLRPDLEILPIRGNVQTRLAKMRSGQFDAIVLAQAGLLRLEMEELPRQVFSLAQMLPAPGQGALGIEVRADDDMAKEWVGRLDDLTTRLAVTAERTALASLHGGCLAPIAALGNYEAADSTLELWLRVLNVDGSQQIEFKDTVRMQTGEDAHARAVAMGQLAAEQVRQQGSDELIASIRSAAS